MLAKLPRNTRLQPEGGARPILEFIIGTNLPKSNYISVFYSKKIDHKEKQAKLLYFNNVQNFDLLSNNLT